MNRMPLRRYLEARRNIQEAENKLLEDLIEAFEAIVASPTSFGLPGNRIATAVLNGDNWREEV